MPLIYYIGADGMEHAPACEAAEMLAHGGIIVYPTETLYGIGADATNDGAARKINRIKCRAPDEPQIVLIRWEWLPKYIRGHRQLLPLLEAFSPGPLTLIARATPGKIAPMLTPRGKIAFRISSSWFVDLLLKELGKPITSTSANISDETALTSAQEIIDAFWDKVDGMFLFENARLDGSPSTIVDATKFPVELKIVREGTISRQAIIEAVRIDD